MSTRLEVNTLSLDKHEGETTRIRVSQPCVKCERFCFHFVRFLNPSPQSMHASEVMRLVTRTRVSSRKFEAQRSNIIVIIRAKPCAYSPSAILHTISIPFSVLPPKLITVLVPKVVKARETNAAFCP